MPNILVTGAASGLGLSLVLALADQNPSSTIYALDKQERPSNFPPHHASSRHQVSQILYFQLDVTDEAAVAQLGRDFDAQDFKLHLVVHSAGVRGLVPHVRIEASDDVAKAETIDSMTVATLRSTFEINAVGFFTLARALLPSLRRAASKGRSNEPTGESDVFSPKVVIMGSRMGSIGHNVSAGGGYAYRASKAALNAMVKSFSIDVPEAVWTVIHPGRVETGLVAVKEEGAISVEDALKDLLPLIDHLKMEDSGRFVDRFGQDVPW